MRDLLDISDNELIELFENDPKRLDELIKDSNLDPFQLAEVFVKRPFLQNSILEISDPTELYNNINKIRASYETSKENEIDEEEYKKIQNEYIYAINTLKRYVLENPEYNKTLIADTLRGVSEEFEDEARGTSLISKDDNDDHVKNYDNMDYTELINILRARVNEYDSKVAEVYRLNQVLKEFDTKEIV